MTVRNMMWAIYPIAHIAGAIAGMLMLWASYLLFLNTAIMAAGFVILLVVSLLVFEESYRPTYNPPPDRLWGVGYVWAMYAALFIMLLLHDNGVQQLLGWYP